MNEKYVLVDGKPRIEPDLMTWVRWFESSDRVVQQDDVGEVQVSTVFLGVDHNFGSGRPMLWETMIFGGPHDQYQKRYATKEDAVEGHARAVAISKTGASPEANP